MSILARGEEIERDFYALKAEEWACEPDEAKKHIEAFMTPIANYFIARRRVARRLNTAEPHKG